METSLGRTQIKSLVAKVTYVGEKYRIYGAAWGRPIKSVEVRIDNGPWLEAIFTLKQEAKHVWKIWPMTGITHPLASTRLSLARSTPKGMSSQRWTILPLPTSILTGKATDKWSGEFKSTDTVVGW